MDVACVLHLHDRIYIQVVLHTRGPLKRVRLWAVSRKSVAEEAAVAHDVCMFVSLQMWWSQPPVTRRKTSSLQLLWKTTKPSNCGRVTVRLKETQTPSRVQNLNWPTDRGRSHSVLVSHPKPLQSVQSAQSDTVKLNIYKSKITWFLSEIWLRVALWSI